MYFLLCELSERVRNEGFIGDGGEMGGTRIVDKAYIVRKGRLPASHERTLAKYS
jgi:hypothetical protein